jgi:hypothetical protein
LRDLGASGDSREGRGRSGVAGVQSGLAVSPELRRPHLWIEFSVATHHATIAAVAATADALSANLAQMQFLEDARNTLRQLNPTKPGDAQ